MSEEQTGYGKGRFIGKIYFCCTQNEQSGALLKMSLVHNLEIRINFVF